jgi:hypothetical protein
MDRLNWAGFYLMDKGSLLVGPFQGRPACIRIEIGKGVCGTAVKEEKIQRVADVHAFPGHIACDAASRSEIVLPIRSDGRIVGVLDIDSPEAMRAAIENSGQCGKTSPLELNGKDFAAFIAPELNASGCATIHNGQLIVFLFTPRDDSDYMLVAAEIMAGIKF